MNGLSAEQKGEEEEGTKKKKMSHLPASLLEESKLQCCPLQHSEGCDCDRTTCLAGKAAL